MFVLINLSTFGFFVPLGGNYCCSSPHFSSRAVLGTVLKPPLWVRLWWELSLPRGQEANGNLCSTNCEFFIKASLICTKETPAHPWDW